VAGWLASFWLLAPECLVTQMPRDQYCSGWRRHPDSGWLGSRITLFTG